MALALGTLFAGCAKRGREGRAAAEGARAQGAPIVTATANGKGNMPVASAVRCEECHMKMADEWRGSAHARSDRAPLYRAMRADAQRQGVNDVDCDRCHAPLVGRAAADEPAVHEGVTCDVCHGIDAVEVRREGSGYRLHTEENVKYGPLCDARDHYFHKMGCSPLHEEARFCGACHLLYRGALPVFTEYEEWARGGSAAAGIDCQRCHMPGTRAEVARGSKARAGVPHHGMLGLDGRLRRRALVLKLEFGDREGGLGVTATLSNKGAGHSVPAGLPGRRIVVRLRALDGSGVEMGRAERALGRVLGDDAGREVPFARATRVLADDRIAMGASARIEVALPAPRAGTLVVEVVWREASAELAAAVGAPAPREEPLIVARVPFEGPGANGRRARLPRAITLGDLALAGRRR